MRCGRAGFATTVSHRVQSARNPPAPQRDHVRRGVACNRGRAVSAKSAAVNISGRAVMTVDNYARDHHSSRCLERSSEAQPSMKPTSMKKHVILGGTALIVALVIAGLTGRAQQGTDWTQITGGFTSPPPFPPP